MKKVIKSRIFLVIITSVICISGTLYAANTYKASDVLYTSSDGTSMNVNDALNELYNKSGSSGYCYPYKDGLAVFYNPVSGEKCDASEVVSTTGTKTGCMKWYIFNYNSESTTVNMILDHNTTATIVWNSQGINVPYEQSNLKAEVDKLVSVSGWVVTPRIISAEEIAQITGNTSWTNTSSGYYLDSIQENGKSKYSWLFDYTTGCTSYGCNIADSSTYGYWTSTTYGTASSGNDVWFMYRSRNMSHFDAAYAGHYGVRPVITISKSILS